MGSFSKQSARLTALVMGAAKPAPVNIIVVPPAQLPACGVEAAINNGLVTVKGCMLRA